MNGLNLWNLFRQGDEAKEEEIPIRRKPNPLLCDECQHWDNISALNTPKASFYRSKSEWQRLSLEYLQQHPECLICRALKEVIEVRCQESGMLQAFPASHIGVTNEGAHFLDTINGDSPQDFSHRIEVVGANTLLVRLIIVVRIEKLRDNQIKLINTYPVNIFNIDAASSESGAPNHYDPLTNIINALTTSSESNTPNHDYPPINIFNTIAASSESNTTSHDYPPIEMIPQFCLRYVRSGGIPKLAAIEPWEIPLFDISLLKKWVDGCQQSHGSMCANSENYGNINESTGFRVIDVLSMKLVKPTVFVRFIALSYMWEIGNSECYVQLQKSNIGALETPGGLTDIPLPQIISDAISLCRDLGEKYLWVDRLCIVQDDEKSKHSQIHNMDTIYSSAYLTVILALNERGGKGIPGFRDCPRRSSIWHPPRGAMFFGRGVNPNGMRTVNSSLWNNRGWTFQERVLSRRRLFITEFQVLFECSSAQAHEELTYCSPHPPMPSFLDPLRFIFKREEMREEEHFRTFPGYTSKELVRDQLDYNSRTTMNLLTYCSWIKDYTSRHLSFESDIMNAFEGVANTIRKSLDSPMLFGLPEKYMFQALMWNCLGMSGQRTEASKIPSWSWAAASKQVNYDWIGGNFRLHGHDRRIASLIYLHYQDPDLGLRKLHVKEKWMDSAATIEEVATEDKLPRLVRRGAPEEQFSNKSWQECPHNPWQCLAHLPLDPDACIAAIDVPGSLVFNTTVASLTLSRDSRNIYAGESFVERDVMICDQQGSMIGRLNMMSPDWIDANVDAVHEFIVLCGSLSEPDVKAMMKEFKLEPHQWILYVMLIERLPHNPHLVRRVDIGFVYTHWWKDCNPCWETIVLC